MAERRAGRYGTSGREGKDRAIEDERIGKQGRGDRRWVKQVGEAVRPMLIEAADEA